MCACVRACACVRERRGWSCRCYWHIIGVSFLKKEIEKFNDSAQSLKVCVCVQVLELSADVLQKIPALIDYEGTRKLLKDDLSPLNVVLLQEIQRYNTLLHTIRSVGVCVRCS